VKPSQLLADRKNWSFLFFACTEDNEPCGVWSKDARKWCLVGACQRYEGLLLQQQRKRLMATPAYAEWCQEVVKGECVPALCLENFNDWGGYDGVMRALREANL
jgi:hypothetical protein